jgi:hypothetical protein
MQQNNIVYQTQKLMDSGVDFNAIYSEKQSIIKDMTGFDFNLQSIVGFLKAQTDNFQKQIPLALDIDKNIKAIYDKWISKGEPTEAPTTPSSAKSSENETVAKLTREINDLKDLIEMETDKKAISKFEKEISDLQELIELEG